MAQNNEFILELMLENGMVTDEQVSEGWQKVADSEGTLNIIQALEDLKYVDPTELLQMLAQQYGMETLDLSSYKIPQEVIEAVPKDVVNQYHIIPVMKHDDVLTIAIGDPTDLTTLDSVRYVLKCDVDAVVAPQAQIQAAIKLYYSDLGQGVDSAIAEIKDMDTGELTPANPDEGGAVNADETGEGDAPIIRLVTAIIVEAYKMHASDIHMEPLEKRYRIRYRVDGVLREVDAPPKYLQPNITSRVKIMSRLDISEKRLPQDGRIQMRVSGCDIDLRVSTIPTTHGESIVMRILEKASIQLEIPQLGFYADDQKKINQIINMPDGVFLVTGPTGSGKTTSLYAFLNTINLPNRKIITVEDPVEYQLPGINQVQVNNLADMTFANALRAMLRQAPNIIMVGEIRDVETATIAINASQTGHLVFSTLHTNDAPSAVTRMIDMGVQPFLVSSAVRAIMAQRLLRRVCKNCAEPTTPTKEEIRLLKLDDKFMDTATLKKGRGCPVCGGTGYKGRVGIYEIFQVGEDIQHLIYKKMSADVIRAAARKAGMITLREDGLRKAAAGITSLQEVITTTMGDAE
ncbi:MAG: Flp pilus assembly complex ATPase component TadA [Lentisphaeria bacterium]|nr:Flp pilus assembly complex ATPase component TadA [Lentisphaeria bacterium]